MPRQDHDALHGNPQSKPAEKRPRSPVGQSLLLHQEAVEHCESLYEATQGEETDDVAQAEAARDLTGKQAAEALAKYLRWLDERDATVAAERARLADFEAATAKRRTWATAKAAALVETLAPGKSKYVAGTLTIKVSRTKATEADKGLDPKTLHAEWQRPVPEVPAVPATVALDKKAAKADILGPWNEGAPPAAGWYEVEGHGCVRLFMLMDAGGWRIQAPGQPPQRLEDTGLSIEAEPGMDTLRWKRSHPSVRVISNVAVKVS